MCLLDIVADQKLTLYHAVCVVLKLKFHAKSKPITTKSQEQPGFQFLPSLSEAKLCSTSVAQEMKRSKTNGELLTDITLLTIGGMPSIFIHDQTRPNIFMW